MSKKDTYRRFEIHSRGLPYVAKTLLTRREALPPASDAATVRNMKELRNPVTLNMALAVCPARDKVVLSLYLPFRYDFWTEILTKIIGTRPIIILLIILQNLSQIRP